MTKTLKETLAALNKQFKEKDMFKKASDMPEDYFKTDFYTTGSIFLDYRLKTEGFGGLPKGRTVILAGGESSGKSSLACIAIAKMQKKHNLTAIYFDGEGTLDDSYLNRFNINRDLLIMRMDNKLEVMLDSAEAFSTTEGIGMIIIDSLPMFVASSVEEKTAFQDSMGVEARKYNARMPIIAGNCRRYGITLICINQYRLSIGTYGDPRTLPRGEWQKYFSSLTIDLTKKDLIFDESGQLVGNKIDVRVKKSKVDSYDKNPITLNFYYVLGFDEVDEYTSLLIELGHIIQSGSWFVLPNDHKVQGKDKLISFLRDNVEYFEELKTLL